MRGSWSLVRPYCPRIAHTDNLGPKCLFPSVRQPFFYGDNCIPNRPTAGNFIAGL
jgi:hypothetical protein